MMVGYIYNGRRYSRGQIISIAMLTVGVMAAALADAQAKGQSLEIGLDGEGDGEAMKNTVIGFSILALAMLLSAFQGIYADRLYAFYGRDHWKEALFYSHMLSLPIFFSSWSTLYSQWRIVASSPSLLSHLDMEKTSPLSGGNIFGSILELVHASPQVQSILDHIPIQVSYLLMNALTQYLCIRGVHLLSAKSSSLTVTVALNIRKLVSLLLSIYLFGNQLGSGVLLGAVLVFVGGGLYGIEGARLRNASKGKGEKAQ
jgi:UDP-xylose/UDP-N-acetylglucosamine transporter B4